MNSTKIFYGTLMAAFVFIGSCQKTELPDSPAPPPVSEKQFTSDNPNLSPEDATRVAEIFYSEKIATRADAKADVKSIVTITDKSGTPAIYAVNLQDGYLLVSATKSYFPILAQADHGTFSLDGEQTGQQVVIQEMLEDIEAVRDSTRNFDCKPMWFPYEEKSMPERITTTRMSNEFYEMQDKWYQKWYDEGIKGYYLFKKPEEMPADMYRDFCTTATDLDVWADTEYNCMEAAMITEKTYDERYMTGPLVTTQWGQGIPYNSNVSGGRDLGCVTIAVGQLMRYYERPVSYIWDYMPDKATSATIGVQLPKFLAELRTELKVSDGGGASIDDALRVFRNKGYNCSKGTHSGDAVYSAIQNKRPVFATGDDKSRNVGHAWIIDGTTSSTVYTEYALYVLSDTAYPRFEYVEVDRRRVYHLQGSVFFHMNWGWNGTDNAWFLDSRIGFNREGDNVYVNYASDRKNIIIK